MDKTMDTAPGGESTQYESIKTVTEDPDKQRGQLGGDQTKTQQAADVDTTSKERGEKTAENIRYGQGISEGGFGGKTTTSTGTAQQAGYGGVAADEDEDSTSQTRREQGYGGGSGVGA